MQNFREQLAARLQSLVRDEVFFPQAKMSHLDTAQILNREQFPKDSKWLHTKPFPLVPLSQLSQPGDYVVKNLFGKNLVAINNAGQLRVLLNTCRHRGTALLPTSSGNGLKKFRCPYHGWSYSLNGALEAVPEAKLGFPDLDFRDFGLQSFPSRAWGGMLWVNLETEIRLPEFDGEFESFGLDRFTVHDRFDQTFRFHWKLGVHAFQEAYHFAFAHQDSATQYYPSNRFLVDYFGEHSRMVLPKKTLYKFEDPGPAFLEDPTQVTLVYFIFPFTVLFFLSDHATLLSFNPADFDTTRVEGYLLKPTGIESPDSEEYYDLNFRIFRDISFEDFKLCESAHASLAASPKLAMTLGSFEEGIARFEENCRAAARNSA